MHRQRKLSLRQRILMKFSKEHYCLCNHCTRCGCGNWEKHHSDIKYITPAFLRPFDDLRYVIESLWSPVVEGVRVAWKANRRAM
jgi:hypothetical protein